MSGLLFALDIAAVVLIALWLWGVERSGEGWRVRLFDMRGQTAAQSGAPAQSAQPWSRLKSRAKTPPTEGRPRANFRTTPASPSSRRPRWRRSV